MPKKKTKKPQNPLTTTVLELGNPHNRRSHLSKPLQLYKNPYPTLQPTLLHHILTPYTTLVGLKPYWGVDILRYDLAPSRKRLPSPVLPRLSPTWRDIFKASPPRKMQSSVLSWVVGDSFATSSKGSSLGNTRDP